MSVVISEWENKLYQELCEGRDRTIATMQAQLRIQSAEAAKEAAAFARKVVKMIEENFDIEYLQKAGSRSSIVDVYDAANEIIAQE